MHGLLFFDFGDTGQSLLVGVYCQGKFRNTVGMENNTGFKKQKTATIIIVNKVLNYLVRLPGTVKVWKIALFLNVNYSGDHTI